MDLKGMLYYVLSFRKSYKLVYYRLENLTSWLFLRSGLLHKLFFWCWNRSLCWLKFCYQFCLGWKVELLDKLWKFWFWFWLWFCLHFRL